MSTTPLLARGPRALSFALLVCCCAVAAPSGVAAQAIDGAFRIGTDIALVGYSATNIEIDGAALPPIENNSSHFGVVPTSLGLNIGGGLSDSFVFGIRSVLDIASGEDSVAFDADVRAETSVFELRLLPYLEFLFVPESAFRPFLGITAGMVTISRETVSGASRSEQSVTSLGIGGQLGLHAFPVAGFSVDPAVFVLYQTGSGEGSGDISVSASGISVALTLGISGWSGGKGSTLPASDEPEYDSSRPYRPARPQALAASSGTDSGMITSSTTLDGIKLLFLAQKTDAARVGLRFTRLAREAQLGECKTLALAMDDETLTRPLAYKANYSRTSGVGVEEVLQAEIDAATLERMLQADAVTFDLCGFNRSLTMRARAAATSFLKKLRPHLPPEPVAPPTPAELPTPAAPAPATEEAPVDDAAPAEPESDGAAAEAPVQ